MELAHSQDQGGIFNAVDMAAKNYGFCPNRIWAAAQSFKRICDLPILLRPNAAKHKEMFCLDGKPRTHQTENDKTENDKTEDDKTENHKQCSVDFCEQSQVNFTSISQRHESPSCKQGPCKPCEPLEGLFPRAVLERAFKKENDQEKHTPTAWQLNGAAIVEDDQKYMAISHVWSDGTGAGSWDGLKVNKCLYHFFRKLAWEEFGCEGIWWDTICIPGKKELRAKALATMHANYEKAKITFVHDCFLRSLPWVNAETACIAILMSPWFSRGWTALELAKSKTVKVAFKGHGKPDIRDLDKDILKIDDTSDPERHKIASDAISRHRKAFRNGSPADGAINIDELLLILSSRHTSWARDRAIISAHLVGAEITGKEPQQDIYKKVLGKIRGLHHAHLFHNLPTMSNGPSWSPVSFLNMPRLSMQPKGPPLTIKGGEAEGKWGKMEFKGKKPSEIPCDWKDIHPYIVSKLRSCLESEDDHIFLVEPGEEKIVRALLVKRLEGGPIIRCQFIGSVYFDSQKPLGLKLDENQPAIIVNLEQPKALVQDDHGENGGTEGCKRKLEDKRNNSFNIKDQGTRQVEQQNSQPQQTEKQMETEALEATSESKGEDNTLSSVIATRLADLNNLLLKEAETGNDEVGRLIHEGAHHRVFMSWAAEHGHYAMAELLLKQYEVAYDCMDNADQILPAGMNAENKPKAVVERTVEHFVSVYGSKDGHGRTPLLLALRGGHSHVALLLLRWYETQYEAEPKDEYGRTPLSWAAEKGHKGVVKLLLGGKADVDSRDNEHGWTPLSWAAGNGHEVVVKLLLDGKADVDLKDEWARTPLSWAAEKGHEAVVKLLLQNKANIDSKDAEHGWTPLSWAAQNGHEAMVELLLENNANVNSKDDVYGRTPLLWVSGQGKEAMVKLLFLKGKADVNLRDKFGQTALSWAAEKGHETVVRLLLEYKTKVDLKDKDGRTPLSWAAEKGHEAVVTLLLDGKADADFKDEWSRTPLLWAVEEGHEAIVKLLLEDKASVNLGDECSRTPLSWAAGKGHEAVVKLLLEYKAKVDLQDKNGRTPLSWAAEEGHESVVKLLLNGKADVSLKDEHGQTPLSWAAKYRHKAVVDLLSP